MKFPISLKFKVLFFLLALSVLALSGCSGSNGPTEEPNLPPEIQCDSVSVPVIVGSESTISCDVNDDGKPSGSIQLSWLEERFPQGYQPTQLPDSGSFSFTPTLAGEYVLRITADDGGLSANADVTFTAIHNTAPEISCVPVDNPPRDELLSIDCSIEDDDIPATATLQWSIQQAPEGVDEIDLGNQASTSFTPSVAGDYTLNLSADDGNASSDENITFTVINTNTAPEISCAKTRFTTAAGVPIQISCEITDDGKPPGNVTTQWSTNLMPFGAIEPQLPSDASFQFTPDINGNYELALTVSDGELETIQNINIWATLYPTISILPLGDSITQGVSGFQSYRYQLWTKLIDAGFNFDFVGNLDESLGEPPATYPDYFGHVFDPDHEGHSGWKADEILAHLPEYQTQYDPDLVLLHIGSNDMFAGVINDLEREDVPSTIVEIENIIDTLRDDNPEVTILLATPISSIHATELEQLQIAVRTLASTITTEQSKVILVDQALVVNPTVGTDSFDGIHPNFIGEGKMAQKWFDAINSL